jgi:hypothetical protein
VNLTAPTCRFYTNFLTISVYSLSPENRRSVTIIEMINATRAKPIPPMLLIQGLRLMVDWFRPELPRGTHIIPTEKGFINDQIAIEYLKHYIKHSDCGPDKP